MNKEIMITQHDLIDWLDRPISNEDIDLINFIVCRLDNFYKLKEKNERLNNVINELDKLIEQYSRNDYYYKYNGKYLKSEIIDDLKKLKEGK